LTPTITFWRFKSPLRFQFSKCEVHSLTLSHTLGNMKCDSQASLLAHTFASPCLGREPKGRVTTHERLWHHLHLKWRILNMMKKMISLFMGNKSNGLKPLLLSMKWSLIMIMLIWKEPMRKYHFLFNFNVFFTNQWFILLLMSKRNNVG